MPRKIGKYQFGPFLFEAAEHRLVRDGAEIALQLKAFETLCILLENSGRLLTKEELLRQVWPDTVVEENNLNKVISFLRKALGESTKGECYIETVPRVGYRFVAPVTQIGPEASAAAPNDQALSQPQPAPDTEKSVAVLYFENLSGDK